ncbi:MAG: c-type cytochrome [bacterium]
MTSPRSIGGTSLVHIAVFSCAITIFTGKTAFGQIPDKFTNLQVLPKNIDKRELVDMMKSFAAGLGVRCQYCHLGEEGKPLDTFDFVSDERPAKQTARLMLRMVETINGEYLSKIANHTETRTRVTCVTCHHGQNRPRSLEAVLYEEIAAQGIQSAVKKYHELRERYYGSFTFDFRERVLINLAQGLQTEGKLDEAIEMLKLNAQFYPNSSGTHTVLGESLLLKGEKKLALESFKKALELDPNNQAAKSKMEELSIQLKKEM